MQLERLDNMLCAEGVSSPVEGASHPMNGSSMALAVPVSGQASPSEGVIENSDYKAKLSQIRSVYHNEYEKYNQVSLVPFLVTIVPSLLLFLCADPLTALARDDRPSSSVADQLISER